MTDRGRAALRQSRDCLRVGPSSMAWTDGRLEVTLDEIAAPPLVSRVRGRIVAVPSSVTGSELPITPDGAHVWRPFAPCCRIRVELEAPGWQWDGHGYFDANFGTRALEQDFLAWTWGRYPAPGGTLCFYDARRRDGSTLEMALQFAPDGSAHAVTAPPVAPMRRSLWALRRSARADAGYSPRQLRAMLDAPFYCRSIVQTRANGLETTGVHEALDLGRFRSPLLKPMLALRVPRRAGWRFD